MLLQDILSFNEKFVENKKYAPREATKIPKKRMVVVSCMDARLIELLPKSFRYTRWRCKSYQKCRW